MSSKEPENNLASIYNGIFVIIVSTSLFYRLIFVLIQKLYFLKLQQCEVQWLFSHLIGIEKGNTVSLTWFIMRRFCLSLPAEVLSVPSAGLTWVWSSI